MELSPTCPAATALDGPDPVGPSIICGAARADAEKRDSFTEGAESPIFSCGDALSVIANFCCGTGLPVRAKEGADRNRSHVECPIWQAEKARVAEHQRRLKEPETRDIRIDEVLEPDDDGRTPLEHWLAGEEAENFS